MNLLPDANNLIYNWERPNDPLAPLSNLQRNIVLDLSQEIKEIGPFYKVFFLINYWYIVYGGCHINFLYILLIAR